jgi:hypothetical protein
MDRLSTKANESLLSRWPSQKHAQDRNAPGESSEAEEEPESDKPWIHHISWTAVRGRAHDIVERRVPFLDLASPAGTIHNVKPLSIDDRRHVQAAKGWCGLHSFQDANAELEQVTRENRDHPDVLEARWQVCANLDKWEEALELADVIAGKAPGKPADYK